MRTQTPWQTFIRAVCFFLCSIPVSQAVLIEKGTLFFVLGEQRSLRFEKLQRFSLGGTHLRSLQEGKGNEILFRAVAEGTGDLIVWRKGHEPELYQYQVKKPVRDILKPALTHALAPLQEVEIHLAGSAVILRGQVRTELELRRIVEIRKSFSEVVDETEASIELIDQGEKKIAAWISSKNLSAKLKLERKAGDVFVSGAAPNPQTLQEWTRDLVARYARVKLDLNSLPDSSRIVHFRVFLLEIKNTYQRSLGLEWPAFKEGAFRVSPTRVSPSLELDLLLKNLEGEGHLKVLSSPELVVRAPGDAELFSGGELPIQSHTRYASQTTWKAFGLTLILKVTHTDHSRVRLDIFTEISSLDESIALGDIPGLRSNKMKTQIDAKFGEPLLLSGLLQDGTRKKARGLPLLRSLPVLGALFGSEDYLNERSELVAILLPSSSVPRAPLTRMERMLPKGPLPAPREWLDPSDEQNLKSDPNYPWNVLE